MSQKTTPGSVVCILLVRLRMPYRLLVTFLLAACSIGCRENYMAARFRDPSLVRIVDENSQDYLAKGRSPACFSMTTSDGDYGRGEVYVARRPDGSIVTGTLRSANGSPVAPPYNEKILVGADGEVSPCDLNMEACSRNPLESGAFLQGGYGISFDRRGYIPLWIKTAKENVLEVERRTKSLLAPWPVVHPTH